VGGLQGPARLLLGEARGGEFPQLVVDERQEFRRSSGVALLDGVQDLGDVGRAPEPIRQQMIRDRNSATVGSF
jgi:hypothetical protein